MRELPRQLTAEQLAELFEGRTRFVERLAAVEDPLGRARTLARELSDDERKEVLDAHPAIGAQATSARSAREHGRIVVRSLFEPRALRRGRAADRRVRLEEVALLAVGKRTRDLARVLERVLRRREALDELAPALEQLSELLGGQLPR